MADTPHSAPTWRITVTAQDVRRLRDAGPGHWLAACRDGTVFLRADQSRARGTLELAVHTELPGLTEILRVLRNEQPVGDEEIAAFLSRADGSTAAQVAVLDTLARFTDGIDARLKDFGALRLGPAIATINKDPDTGGLSWQQAYERGHGGEALEVALTCGPGAWLEAFLAGQGHTARAYLSTQRPDAVGAAVSGAAARLLISRRHPGPHWAIQHIGCPGHPARPAR